MDLLGTKGIKTPLPAGTIGVLSRGEAPRGQRQLFEHIGCRTQGHLPVKRPLGQGIGFAVGQDEQGVVVEHFFKVGDAELGVGGVAGETAAHMVENAAPEELLQGFLRHSQGILIPRLFIEGQETEKAVAHGEFGRAAKAAVFLVEGGFPLPQGLKENIALRRGVNGGGQAPQQRRDLLRRGQKTLSVVLPGVPDGDKQLRQAQLSGPSVFGEIGPGEKGLLFWGEEDGGGPAAPAGEGLTDGHIDAVDVGPLLPVHFDGDETLVEQGRDGGVRKGLPGHHMAPVTGAVADAQKNGLILRLGPLQGFRAPGVPVHGVFRVLEQVGAGLPLQMVHSRTLLFA